MSKYSDIILMRIIMSLSGKMSDCSRTKHGAMLAERTPGDNIGRVWATGVNQNHTIHDCVRTNSSHGTHNYDGCPAIHAEQDMFAWLVKSQDSHFDIRKCVMYVTGIPCPSCAKLIVACDVKELVILIHNRELGETEKQTLKMLNKHIHEVRIITENEVKTINTSKVMGE